jgi:hypothetical protein
MAAPTATVNGTAVNFAFQGTNGITITGVSGTLLQTSDLSAMADCEVVRDNQGAEVVHAWYNFHNEGTLEWVVTSGSLSGAINNSSLNTLFAPGKFLTITACTSCPEFVATWEVQSGAKHTKSNTTSSKISVPIKLFGGITAVAS